jgi:hypothetical protein
MVYFGYVAMVFLTVICPVDIDTKYRSNIFINISMPQKYHPMVFTMLSPLSFTPQRQII